MLKVLYLLIWSKSQLIARKASKIWNLNNVFPMKARRKRLKIKFTINKLLKMIKKPKQEENMKMRMIINQDCHQWILQ